MDIVFSHATGFNALTYRAVLAPLARRRRILVLDQRGHGSTSLPADPAGRVDWLDFRDDLLALSRVLGLKGVVLSGHSMGATVSLLAAAAAPELAARLVLLEPVVFLPKGRSPDPARAPLVQAALRRRALFPNRQAALAAYAGRGAFASWPAEMVADYVAGGFVDLSSGEVALACDPKWEAAIYAFQAHDSWTAFQMSKCPIDIWRAETDSTFRIEDRLAELTASGRVRVRTVRGASHFLPMERPDAVRRALA
ncbi:MAG: alpha/beta fold hydrolase [Caulobacteraceae bacterium]